MKRKERKAFSEGKWNERIAEKKTNPLYFISERNVVFSPWY